MSKTTVIDIFCLVIILFVANFMVYRLIQPGAQDSTPPELLVVSPEVLEMGDITQAPFAAEFAIRNESNLEVTLLEPETTCNCTQVEIPQQILQPGGSVRAAAEIKGGSRAGLLQVLVSIPYKHAEGTGKLSLVTRGKVLPHISLNPESVSINMNDEKPVEIICQTNYGPEVSVSQVHCTSAAVNVTVSKETGSPPKIILTPILINDKVDIPVAKPAYVSISTTSEWMPYLRVPVLLNKKPVVE